MGGNFEKSMYNQLMEVMARFDAVEQDLNTYNSRQHTKRKAGGQKGHKGTTLTKAEVEEKKYMDFIASGSTVEPSGEIHA